MTHIFITGPAASGKDTARHALLVEGICSFEVRCAALPRQIAGHAQVDGIAGPITREALQALGDGLRTAYGEDALARHADNRARRIGHPCVCPDVRLPAEGRYLREHGWIGVRIERDNHARYEELERRGEDFATLNHRTETGYRDVPVDTVVTNDCGREEFERRIVEKVREVLMRHREKS